MEAEIDKRENGLKGIDELFQSVQEFATSARFKELLDFTAHFKQYAPYNAMLIYIQRPGARFVLPPRWWERYNRVVIHDRRPIVILQPFSPVAYVYDIEDTDIIAGCEDKFPPELAKPYDGDPTRTVDESTFRRLIGHLKYWGILYETMRTGESFSGKIEIGRDNDPRLVFPSKTNCPGQWRPAYTIRVCEASNISVKFCAILHELGHLFCRHIISQYDHDWQGGVRAISHAAKEFEAETVSWLVSRRLGVDNPSYQYLAGYFRQHDAIPPEVSVDEILKATRLVEMVLTDTRLENAWLYKKCSQFKKQVDAIKAERNADRKQGA